MLKYVFNVFFWMVIMTEQNSLLGENIKEKLFGRTSFISAKLSPNGQWMAIVGEDESSVLNVSLSSVHVDVEMTSEQLTYFDTPQIIQFFWSADSQKVLLLKDEEGTGQLNLHGFDIRTKKHVSYTEEFPGVTTKVYKVSTKENKAVIGLNQRNPKFHDLYLLDLDTGELALLLRNDTYAKFLLSDDLEIILKIEITKEGSWIAYLKNDTIFLQLSSEEAFNTEFLSYDPQKKLVNFLDNRFTDTTRLTQKKVIAPFEEKILGGDERSDIDDVIFAHHEPLAYATYWTQKKWEVLDGRFQKDITFLSHQIGENFEILSQSRESDFWIVSNSFPDQGTFTWLYRRKDFALVQLSPPLEKRAKKETFAKMYDTVVSARDGKKLVCYYTIPKEFDRGGTVENPVPLVVIPHGGPFKFRDKYEFNAYHQWLASCGYIVLSVNFRLSSGFGKSFVNAGNGEWGGKAHLDVIDAVEALIQEGLTERGKIAIFGGSYGGYEALAGLTFTPDFFTCAVAICGPSHLKTVLQSVPEFWEFTVKPLSDKLAFFTKKAFITSMGGDPDEEKGSAYLEKCSPLSALDEIQAPLLLIHGKNDHVVTEKESHQIFQSMRKKGLEVTYIQFPNEGHRFGHYVNKMMFLEESEKFLSHYLKGTYTPLPSKALAGASGIVMTEKDAIEFATVE